MKVSEIALGSTTFGGQIDGTEATRIIERAWDAGVNFFDTADSYGNSLAETIIGKALKGRRQATLIGTKVSNRVGPHPNDAGLSRKHIMDAVHNSLRRLQTDYIDLYQAHQWDPGTPIEETLRAFDDLVRQGKVRYIGCSNFAAWQLCKALWISDVQNLASFEAIQSRYNLISREIEQEIVPLCQAEGIGITVFNPTAGGFLTGKYRRGEAPPADTRFAIRGWYRERYWTDRNFDAVEKLRPIAAASGKSLVHLALGWVLAKPAVASVIVGASSVAQLDENVGVVERRLTPDEVAACDRIQGPFTPPRCIGAA